jgi:3-phosphoshikimate 1-carboxyvinyltransferase
MPQSFLRRSAAMSDCGAACLLRLPAIGADTLVRMDVTGHADHPWLAPAARSAVSATVRLPGSKSMTNRALILAALSATPTTIEGPLQARDTSLMSAAIAALGATVTRAPGSWTVLPGRASGPVTIDVGNAGTVLRFVPPAAALAESDVEFRGDPRVSQRPVSELLSGLRQAGVDISDGGRGAVPFTVRGRGAVRGGRVILDASSSSQLVSGLMLAAPRFDDGLQIIHQGERIPSAPHIAMSVAMLTAAGADVEATVSGHDGQAAPDSWRIRPGRLAPGRVAVEPDLSNAAPFLAAALVTGGQVTIPGWPAVSLQAASQILDVLRQMGASTARTPDGLRIEGTGRIRGIRAYLADVSELAPVLTAVAALADGPSEFTGIGHMRLHESDRLAALATEIGALGGHVTELPDGLEVQPRPLRAGPEPFDSHDDHRLVMAAAVLGLAVPGLRIANAGTVGKTFPAFGELWRELLGQPPAAAAPDGQARTGASSGPRPAGQAL